MWYTWLLKSKPKKYLHGMLRVGGGVVGGTIDESDLKLKEISTFDLSYGLWNGSSYNKIFRFDFKGGWHKQIAECCPGVKVQMISVAYLREHPPF